jgi:hypothetical protein
MKNKIVKTFEEHTENLNISGVSNSEKLYTKEQMLKFAEKAFDDAWGDDCEYITFPQWLDDNSKFL